MAVLNGHMKHSWRGVPPEGRGGGGYGVHRLTLFTHVNESKQLIHLNTSHTVSLVQ